VSCVLLVQDSSALLWARLWTFEIHEMRGISSPGEWLSDFQNVLPFFHLFSRKKSISNEHFLYFHHCYSYRADPESTYFYYLSDPISVLRGSYSATKRYASGLFVIRVNKLWIIWGAFDRLLPTKLAEAVTCAAFVLEVLCSNFGWDTRD
jgi:hypothetical protein